MKPFSPPGSNFQIVKRVESEFLDLTLWAVKGLKSAPVAASASSVVSASNRSSGSDQTQREEDFYYTKISCETVDASSAPAPAPPPPPLPPPPPPQPALGQASSSRLGWASSCGSPPAPGLHIPPAHRPRSNSSSGPCPSRPSPLSQSAPSSFWQIHSEHLYQVSSPAASVGASLLSHALNKFIKTHIFIIPIFSRCRFF